MKLRTLTLALALAISAPIFAQDTSSAITGKITDTEGAAVSGATVKILHVPSGSTKTVVTDANGRYNSRGLRIGGPYVISIEKEGFDSTTKENVALKLGETGTVNAQIGTEAVLQAVTVTASAMFDTFDPAKMGASTIVGREQIEAFPTISRSINDYVRLDPRVTQIDKSNGAISVAGQNNRYNSVTIDGVPTNDEFGLNQGGLPSLNQPISLDTIEELSIGIASFDVTANDATGANINAVTKSGTNEFKGNVSAYYRKADWTGDDAQGRDFTGFEDELTFGFTLGGPILQDRLFFFIAAEDFKSAAPAPTLNQAVRGNQTFEVISQADITRIRAAAPRYGFAVGDAAIAGIDNTDRKYIAKIDWQINDAHRASLRWNQTKGETLEVRDNSATSLSFSDHWFNRIQDNESIVLNTYSDWTDNFNTEFSISNSEYKSLVPLVSNTPEVTVTAGPNRFLFGGERFRHANRLLVDTTTGFFAGNLFAGDHTIKFGADFKRVDTFNLFLESAFGRYEFGSVADLEAGRVARYTLRFPGAGPGTNVDAAAANWALDSIGVFAQDTWIVNSNLTLNYGLRYDVPKIDEVPAFNAVLAGAALPPAAGSSRPLGGLGLNNTGTPDGNGVIQPRAGFNYTFDSERRMQLRGGLGLFTGSPPGVWLSNNFSETGTLISEFVVNNPASPFLITADPNLVPRPTAGGIPPRGTVNLLDDKFEMPTVWKGSLAFESELGFYNLIGSVEALFTDTENGIFYDNLNLGSPNNNAAGRLPDGRIHYYQNLSPTNFTNLNGQPAAGAGRRATENANFFDVLVLRNTNKGKTRNYTIGLEKPMLDNWYAKLSYTLGESSEPNPGAEARAITNWSQRPVFNTNEEVSATSNFEISDRITLALSYKHAFFADLNTTFSLFGEGRTGRKFSYVFRNDANGDNANAPNDLFYVPRDRNDVGFRDVVVNGATVTAAQQADLFWSYIESNEYLNERRGQAAARNGQDAPWVTQFDFRLTQELPALFDTKSEIYLDILNIGNLINDRYGFIDDTGFGGTVAVADFIGTEQIAGASSPRYVYRFTGAPNEFVRQDTRGQSRWGAQLGIRVSF
jgi:outer membrane receptor protein involved in Fe transport